MSPTQNPDREKGISLARGPALILGTILLVAGLYFLYKLHGFPKLSQFPSGKAPVEGKAFLGIFGLNGWSGELTAAAGGLLLFGAAQHLLAKTMSLVVGVVLAVVAVIALVHHHSALGLFAANIWTIVLWGASAALLLINTLLPRRTPAVEEAPAGAVATRRSAQPDATVPRTRQPPAAESPRVPADAPGVRQPVQGGADTRVSERPPVRVRPTDGSASDGNGPGA
jgi:hypothetical protein